MSDFSQTIEQCTPAQIIFFQTLHDMIDNESHTGCIDWAPDGKGFAILLKQTFEANVLPLYFGKVKFTSFTRRLKRWGFKRSSIVGGYHHTTFHRGMEFDGDYAEEPTYMNITTSPVTLPPKKRTKWMSTSPSPFEDQPPSYHGSTSPKNSDVDVLPELMRTINRLKRKERKAEGQLPMYPLIKKEKMCHNRNISRASRAEQSIEAAETLALFGQQETPRWAGFSSRHRVTGDFLVSPTPCNGHTRQEREINNIGNKVHRHQMKGDNHYESLKYRDAYFSSREHITDNRLIKRTKFRTLPFFGYTRSMNRETRHTDTEVHQVNRDHYYEIPKYRNADFLPRRQVTNIQSPRHPHLRPPSYDGYAKSLNREMKNPETTAHQINNIDYHGALKYRNVDFPYRRYVTNDQSPEDLRFGPLSHNGYTRSMNREMNPGTSIGQMKSGNPYKISKYANPDLPYHRYSTTGRSTEDLCFRPPSCNGYTSSMNRNMKKPETTVHQMNHADNHGAPKYRSTGFSYCRYNVIDRSIEDTPLGQPSFHGHIRSLNREMKNPATNVRQVKSHDFSSRRYITNEGSTEELYFRNPLLDGYTSSPKRESKNSKGDLRSRIPINNLRQRTIPAFNRAA
mmetsp:Transcript_4277/g.9484  ORF Transcript_4277/g.9484 Transcript_4277/m.9484 type:complete len:623 (+) Transcript_4277:195-2063(+)